MPEKRQDFLTVRTGCGDLRGTREHNGVRVWRGVPYAQPPLGDRRFQAPAPCDRWEGVRDAVEFRPVCPQPPLGGKPVAEPMNEDCLYLNVWSLDDASGLPVMVWIHGGAFLVGSGSSPDCRGLHLARKGPAVIVTINYRLGYRGFLDLSWLPGAEGRFATNAGTRDQIAALQWVRDNIAAFGGNPDNVTIFGQSAGGAAVSTLLSSPLAKGLFHAAIMQSPPADSIFSKDQARGIASRFLELAGLQQAGFDDVLNVDQDVLLQASLKLVEETADTCPAQEACQPVIDGEVLLDRPAAALAAGHGSAVPIIIGSNEDEGSLFAHPPMPPLVPAVKPNSREFLRQNYPDTQAAIVSAYDGHGRFGTEISIGGDGMVTMPVVHIAEAHCLSAPVHVYRFRWTHEPLMEKKLGTPHTLDVPFVFGTFEKGGIVDLEGEDAEEIMRISDMFQGAWLNFARDRKPQIPSLQWPAYDRQNRHVLVIDRELSVLTDPDHQQRVSWGPIKPLV